MVTVCTLYLHFLDTETLYTNETPDLRRQMIRLHPYVFAQLVPSYWQVWNKLLSTCNKVDEANRLATSCSNKSDNWHGLQIITNSQSLHSLVGTTCSKSVTIVILATRCNKVITRFVPDLSRQLGTSSVSTHSDIENNSVTICLQFCNNFLCV
jgi:hypothetical protein